MAFTSSLQEEMVFLYSSRTILSRRVMDLLSSRTFLSSSLTSLRASESLFFISIFFFFACTNPVGPAHVTLTAPTTTTAPASTVGGSLPQTLLPLGTIAWRWDGDQPGFGRSFYRGPRTASDGALACSYTRDIDAARLACASGNRELWHQDEDHAFMDDAALVVHRGTLYAARYSDNATGCTLDAFDARTGVVRWTRRLAGIGPTAHSEYLNAVELRIVRGYPVAFGWESNGRYIEALDPTTGAPAFHAVVP